jgi:hypothetical protein
MKILFLPFSIVAGVIAGFVSKQAFQAIWGLIDDEDPPDSKYRDISLPKLLTAMALQGAIFTVVRKLVDHQARKAFAGAFGAWPGEEQPEAK